MLKWIYSLQGDGLSYVDGFCFDYKKPAYPTPKDRKLMDLIYGINSVLFVSQMQISTRHETQFFEFTVYILCAI